MKPTRSSIFLVNIIYMIILVVEDSLAQQEAGRIIKIPLIRGVTPKVGTLGQPVISYYAPVHIGTPAKVFNIQFDVGYSDLFIPHYSWSPFKVNLHYGKGFLCKESSTCVRIEKKISSDYLSCKLTGKPYDDVITLTSAYKSNVSLEYPIAMRQNFLAAYDASDSKFKQLPVDGFFGLGHHPTSSAQLNNFIFSLHNARLIDNLQFSFWFNPVLDSNQGGELVLGGVDTARYQGQIYWHHLANMEDHWTINLQSVTMGSQQIGCNGQRCVAYISSALNDIYGPQEQVKRIYNVLNTVPQESGINLIDCRRISSLPTVTLTMDGIPYSLLPSNYIRKTTEKSMFGSETCYVAILALNGSGNLSWILGTNFLGAYYSIFDVTYRQIGFASLR